MTRGPARMPLTPRQAQVLTAAATGASLNEIGRQLGVTRERVSTLLSEAYQRLDVTYLPSGQRRPAAVRVARRRGLIPPAHDAGPSIADCKVDDVRWPLEKHGE